MSINKQQIRKSFTKAISTYEQEAFVQYQIATELCRLLSVYSDHPISSILEIGCGTGFFTRLLRTSFPSATITANDLCSEVVNYIPDDIKFISGDMETINFPDKYDLIAGSSAIQWLENLPLFSEKMNRTLSEKGLVAISTFGEKTNYRHRLILLYRTRFRAYYFFFFSDYQNERRDQNCLFSIT